MKKIEKGNYPYKTKLDYKKMEVIFRENNFSGYGFSKIKTSNDRFYWFKDNGGDILAVAHLDSVQKPTHFNVDDSENSDTIIFSPVLDDRLGVYLIVEYLQNFNLKYDILLTTDEEGRESTAMFFENNKQYNWGFEFDRKGDDVVNYQYSNTVFNNLLKGAGFIIGNGSYSDISELERLGCKFFNIGCGYYKYHSSDAYASTNEIHTQVDRFVNFYKNNHNVFMPHPK